MLFQNLKSWMNTQGSNFYKGKVPALCTVCHAIKKNFFLIATCLPLFICVYLLLLPQTHYKIGNVFFGAVPKLYNVNLSQYFFIYAAYPLFGEAAPYAHYQLSRTYFIKGDLKVALREAKMELELYPDHARTYYILGLTYGYMNLEEEGIEAYSKFIESTSYTWAARNDKAWLQFRIGDIEGGLATMEPIAWVTNNPWIQNTYGTLLMNAGRTAEAKIAFENAKVAVDVMGAERWGGAYPGNDPRIYETGLRSMKKSIEMNLELID